ncbi:hypothetical protein O9X99_02065 [Agrobacterium salinitolerans]|uniref:Uncharacterized protein n=1 Tax=Agrobacterium salinitolerans TaxID=1183413 RepID=A0ABY3BUQ0_9HYPH|nr:MULTISPECIES: hypothetical protein [Agrobacterium]MCZ7890453.1 hypothetical protein [Agrobacterium salinitolerans]TRA96825.1 hypothetical protein EXN23_00890 [Agrobacterium salinitolerans]
MKEVTIQDIRKIEDAELRWLTRYEYLINWGKSGTLRKAAQAFYDQIAAAEQTKAVAELRVAQINVIEKAVARFDVKSIRNAQMAEVAAKHRADAAERQAIREAVDEVLALEEIVPADDIDDILSLVSAALGIELPSDADRADICQRSHKSMTDLKRELGPSLWDQRMADHEKDRFPELAKSDRLAKLILAYSTSISHHHLMKDCADEPLWISSFDHMIACRDRLYQAVATLRDHADDTKKVEWVEPQRGHVSPVQEVATLVKRPASFISRGAAHEWLLENVDVFEASTFDWLDRYYPEEDDEALDAACNVVSHPFDAGKTLEQLGWSPPSDEPPDPPYGITSRAEAIRRMAS